VFYTLIARKALTFGLALSAENEDRSRPDGGVSSRMNECKSMQAKARVPASVVVAQVEWDDSNAP
jgi:hypothetical protein